MSDDQIGSTEGMDPEVVKELQEIQNKIEKYILETIKGGGEYTYFLMIQHDSSKIAVYTGNGCPACAATRSIGWCIENDIRHLENNLPVAIGIPFRMPKTKKGDIH